MDRWKILAFCTLTVGVRWRQVQASLPPARHVPSPSPLSLYSSMLVSKTPTPLSGARLTSKTPAPLRSSRSARAPTHAATLHVTPPSSHVKPKPLAPHRAKHRTAPSHHGTTRNLPPSRRALDAAPSPDCSHVPPRAHIPRSCEHVTTPPPL